jgi:hsp70-interacting protein
MWEPLQNLLIAPSSSDAIKTNVLWIIGTAVQNNPAAQNAVCYIIILSGIDY